MMKHTGRAAGVAIVAALAGCGWFGSKEDTYVEQPVEVLYNRALDDLGAQNYKEAAKEFEEVDRQHPYSVWATKAQIMVAFTYYQSNKYDDAIIALDRFIQLHPGHRDIPYAYYLKALCYYEQISDVGRDQRVTQQALDALAEVVKRFPDSPYSRDARLKVELAIDVEFCNNNATGELGGELLDLRSDGRARTAPRRPEVDDHRHLGVQHDVLERFHLHRNR